MRAFHDFYTFEPAYFLLVQIDSSFRDPAGAHKWKPVLQYQHLPRIHAVNLLAAGKRDAIRLRPRHNARNLAEDIAHALVSGILNLLSPDDQRIYGRVLLKFFDTRSGNYGHGLVEAHNHKSKIAELHGATPFEGGPETLVGEALRPNRKRIGTGTDVGNSKRPSTDEMRLSARAGEFVVQGHHNLRDRKALRVHHAPGDGRLSQVSGLRS